MLPRARQSLRAQHVSPAYLGSAGPPQAVDTTASVAAAVDTTAAVAAADDATAAVAAADDATADDATADDVPAVATADAVRAAVMMADEDGPNSRNPDCVWMSPDSRRRGRAGPRRNSRTPPCPRYSCLQRKKLWLEKKRKKTINATKIIV
jgi:hypothetical protein